jgi:hypothetical protein
VTQALSPLQQKLRLNSLKQVRSERARRLAPAFAAFAETTDRFSYVRDKEREEALTRSIEGLHHPYGARLIACAAPLPGEDALNADLARIAREHGLNGDARLWIGDFISHSAAHVAPQECRLGFFTADLTDIAKVAARIVSMEEQVVHGDMALVAADSGWMIHINRDGTLTLTMPR